MVEFCFLTDQGGDGIQNEPSEASRDNKKHKDGARDPPDFTVILAMSKVHW